mmetsp:Transcript_8009/g.15524  ORF Transcript_8009/g.15524 Transcript_8009/m.15524 type:complete len:94 (-) Transcript_8009:668-949(-)
MEELLTLTGAKADAVRGNKNAPRKTERRQNRRLDFIVIFRSRVRNKYIGVVLRLMTAMECGNRFSKELNNNTSTGTRTRTSTSTCTRIIVQLF